MTRLTKIRRDVTVKDLDRAVTDKTFMILQRGTGRRLYHETDYYNAGQGVWAVFNDYGMISTCWTVEAFMRDPKILEGFYVEEEVEPILKLVEVDNGRQRYTTTREATEEELIRYYSK